MVLPTNADHYSVMFWESHLAADDSAWVHALRHIETGEYVCLRQSEGEHLAVFTDGDAALRFRDRMELLEFVDIVMMRLVDAPFDNFWLDGETVTRKTPASARTR